MTTGNSRYGRSFQDKHADRPVRPDDVDAVRQDGQEIAALCNEQVPTINAR